MDTGRERTISVSEHPEVPWLSVLLGYGPMSLIAIGAVIAWFGSGTLRGEAILVTILYSASILAFLAGVRRGLSFRTEGGPAFAQLATMLGLYLAALIALLSVAHGFALPALLALILGYAAVMLLDPVAARAGQAPLLFVRLRPPQMLLAVLGLLALAVRVWPRT